jgi:hypothetical protein
MRITMTSASCSPAVASRRAKYFGDFRVRASAVHLPMCAKTRGKTITQNGTPEKFCQNSPGRRKTAIFFYREF